VSSGVPDAVRKPLTKIEVDAELTKTASARAVAGKLMSIEPTKIKKLHLT